jgi:hypothetical protein
MVGAPDPDPGDAGFARHLDRGVGGKRHHQMAHAIVAVDDGGADPALGQLDVRPRVDAALAQPAHVLRQAKYAVGIGAGEVGLDHGAGHDGGVLGGQAAGAKRIRREGQHGGGRDAWLVRGAPPVGVIHGN